MILSRERLKFLIEDFDILFPAPDPNFRVDDMLGRFKGIVPEGKSGVEFIREQRRKELETEGIDEEA